MHMRMPWSLPKPQWLAGFETPRRRCPRLSIPSLKVHACLKHIMAPFPEQLLAYHRVKVFWSGATWMSCDAEEAVARLCDRVSCDVTQLRQVLSVRCERIAAVGFACVVRELLGSMLHHGSPEGGNWLQLAQSSRTELKGLCRLCFMVF